MPPMSKSKAKDKPADEREIVHPKLTVCGIEIPDDALIVDEDRMKEILGWQEEPEDGAFGNVYLYVDARGKKIRLVNNAGNRPFDKRDSDKIMQDILNRHWAGPSVFPGETVNGESMIVSRFGNSLSLQHRGVGLLEAVLQWQGWLNGQQSPDRAEHWKAKWPDGPPFIESLLVCGVSEDPRVIRTIDNVRARTFSDVLYTSGVFGDLSSKDRERVSKVLANAVKLLWHRAGADLDAYSGRRTHSEGIDFVERHPKIVDAVKFINDKDQKSAISNWVGVGTAAGLLYMMGCSASDPEKYRLAEKPDESLLDWKYWKKACDFWSKLAAKSDELKALTLATRPMVGDDPTKGHGGFIFSEGEGSGSAVERVASIIKAWNVWSLDARLTPTSLALTYHTDTSDDGLVAWVKLDEFPVCGGIDQGEPEDVEPHVEQVEYQMTMAEHIEDLKKKHPQFTLLFASDNAENPGWNVWAEDAEAVEKALASVEIKAKRDKKNEDMLRLRFDAVKLSDYCSLMRIAGLRPATVTKGDDGALVVAEHKAASRPAPKPISRPATTEKAPEPVPAPKDQKKVKEKQKKKPKPLSGGTNR